MGTPENIDDRLKRPLVNLGGADSVLRGLMLGIVALPRTLVMTMDGTLIIEGVGTGAEPQWCSWGHSQ